MKKSIEFSLVPDENKLYNAKMFKEDSAADNIVTSKMNEMDFEIEDDEVPF